MKIVLITLTIISITILFIISIYVVPDYVTHVRMSKKQCLPYDFADFNTFIRVFKQYEGNPKIKYDQQFKSIFLNDDNNKRIIYFHASIIQINGKCMILYPLDFLKYCIWQKRIFFCKYRVKGLWNNVDM